MNFDPLKKKIRSSQEDLMDSGTGTSIDFLRKWKISETPAFDLFLAILFSLLLAHVCHFPPTLVILVSLSLSIPIHVALGISTETTRALRLG